PIGIHDTVIRKGAFRISPSDSWCGRTFNSLGEPIDGLGPITEGLDRRSISNTGAGEDAETLPEAERREDVDRAHDRLEAGLDTLAGH
ncbi:hypothetical protein ACCS53_38060, partial [Rhizobium ruizarguesonis]